MVEGEHCLITISDPDLLAAPEGAVVGGGVPPGTPAAVYEVTLLAFTAAKEKWQMNNAEKVRGACWWGVGVLGCAAHHVCDRAAPTVMPAQLTAAAAAACAAAVSWQLRQSWQSWQWWGDWHAVATCSAKL
jgi:hypothetical protein